MTWRAFNLIAPWRNPNIDRPDDATDFAQTYGRCRAKSIASWSRSDDLHRSLRADSIEDDVPSGPTSLADVMSEDPGQDIVARLAT